jgi:DNA gyrase subunit A
MSHGTEEVLLTTAQGKTVRFQQEEVRATGRDTSGVIGVNLGKGDSVVGMGLVRDNADLLVVTRKGYGKRTALDEYPRKGRGTSGVITIKLRHEQDAVAAAHVVYNSSLLTFITASGIVMRTEAEGISRIGRSTQGVTILNLGAGDYLAALSQEEPEELEHDPDTEIVVSPNGSE